MCISTFFHLSSIMFTIRIRNKRFWFWHVIARWRYRKKNRRDGTSFGYKQCAEIFPTPIDATLVGVKCECESEIRFLRSLHHGCAIWPLCGNPKEIENVMWHLFFREIIVLFACVSHDGEREWADRCASRRQVDDQQARVPHKFEGRRWRAKMLRFLSRRRARSVGGQTTSSQIKNQRLLSNKNVVQCRVVLLDGTDLPIELSVSMEEKKT